MGEILFAIAAVIVITIILKIWDPAPSSYRFSDSYEPFWIGYLKVIFTFAIFALVVMFLGWLFGC